MERVTHREYLLRVAWREKEWNNPDRSDHYLMQIAMYTAGKKKVDQPSNYKMLFVHEKVTGMKRAQAANQQRADASRTAWGVALGGKK